jgi:hypothetical protein
LSIEASLHWLICGLWVTILGMFVVFTTLGILIALRSTVRLLLGSV